MNETMITLGNRKYRVGYEEGQEQSLQRAVELYDEEMQKLASSSMGVRENQHLMLGGLMLAYRFADNEVDQSESKDRLRELEVEFARTKDQLTNFSKAEKELQDKIKQLGDEKAQLAQELEKATGDAANQNSDQVDALKAEIAQLKSAKNEAPVSEVDHDELLKELTKMRGELNAVKAENQELRAAKPSEPKSAEDGIASALGEIVSGLEGLAK